MDARQAVFWLLLCLPVAAVVWITWKLAAFLAGFREGTQYIRMQMQHAYDRTEYQYWRKELRCHYLCLLPFVNEKNVMRVYAWIPHRPRHAEKKEKNDGIYALLLPSLLAVAVGTVGLCGVSWAWFTASRSSGVATIQTAQYRVDVTVTPADSAPQPLATDEATLAAGIYRVAIRAHGSAQTGYCVIRVGETDYYTPQIDRDTTFSFTLKVTPDDVSLRITPQWGTCVHPSESLGGDDPTLVVPSGVPLVRPQDTTVPVITSSTTTAPPLSTTAAPSVAVPSATSTTATATTTATTTAAETSATAAAVATTEISATSAPSTTAAPTATDAPTATTDETPATTTTTSIP